MNGKKRLKVSLGYDDFRDLRERGIYFVDKSLFIKELMDRDDKVSLITRPRRFGKTLNLSMLKYFWEIPACRVNETNLDRDMNHLFAVEQIREKRYVEGVKATGYSQVTSIGVGFKGKEVKVRYRFAP